jgi:tRNA (uracil-5-)-methyltransferase TRM9
MGEKVGVGAYTPTPTFSPYNSVIGPTNTSNGCSCYNDLVKPETVQYLIDLNRQFYQTFALQFSATRQRLQPGVQQVLQEIHLESNILDLGCGNGELVYRLRQRGHSGWYLGLDFNQELLDLARRKNSHDRTLFLQRDLTQSGWEANLPHGPFDLILAFAFLHHLPSRQLHRQVLKAVRQQLDPGGKFIHSEWQFLNSERLRARIQPWAAANLTENEVETGDYLLDWRHGGHGLRYIHHFSLDELAELADEVGFQITDSFNKDGQGGQLGLYQTWRVKNAEKRNNRV